MCIVAGLAVFFTLLMYAGQSWQVSLLVAALVAPVSATVELFSRRGMDTLTVPFSVAFVVMPLMFVFGISGGIS
jgi:phytol kinase